jgi:hypothetical protein
MASRKSFKKVICFWIWSEMEKSYGFALHLQVQFAAGIQGRSQCHTNLLHHLFRALWVVRDRRLVAPP